MAAWMDQQLTFQMPMRYHQSVLPQLLSCQPYRSEPAAEFYAPRCWALDRTASRDFLKTLLRRRHPEWAIPIWSLGAKWDPELNLLAVQLGLDTIAPPTQLASCRYHYDKVFTRLVWKSMLDLAQLAQDIDSGLQSLPKTP